MSRMNHLQANLYQLLKEIDEICNKYDIKYFLAGGTALGTVRNHCFLPWDDDIDLYITRDNWNKLRHVLESEENVVPEGRSFAYNENTKYYCNPIPRYVDHTTTAIYKSQALAGKACGQHIELLIMDPMPNDEKEREEYIDLLRVYAELLSPYFVVCKSLSFEEWEKHYKLYEEYCRRVDKEGEEKVLKELEEKLQQFPTDECKTYCMRWGINTLMYEKEYYGKGRLEKFEEDEFPVAEYAERIFRVAYGDSWMYVPDYEDQVVHNAMQDIDIPFHIYTDEYIGRIKRDPVFKKYKKNKRSNASVFYKRKKVQMLVAKEKAFVEGRHVTKYLEENEDHLRSLLESKNYGELSQELSEYNRLQLHPHMRKYNIIIPISDRNLATIMLSFIEQGKYYNANKYLNLRKTKEEPMSEELIEIEKTMNVCKELSIARYDLKDEELVQSIIDEHETQYPDLLDIYRSKLWIMENNAKTMEDYEKIDALCDEVLKTYPFDGETMATQAKAKLECGHKDEAMKLYEKSVENTRNGLVWQKVKDESGISRIDIERDIIESLAEEE